MQHQSFLNSYTRNIFSFSKFELYIYVMTWYILDWNYDINRH
jgi:hypothetical protein